MAVGRFRRWPFYEFREVQQERGFDLIFGRLFTIPGVLLIRITTDCEQQQNEESEKCASKPRRYLLRAVRPLQIA